ncbi:Gfo/Idh/MocA family protein [Chloroflexota bacterium]
MRILVVGCGSIGKRHLGNLKLLSAGELIAFDTNYERLEEVKEKYNVKTFSNFEEAMQVRPDAVLVCAPTSLHMNYALVAANSCCHLFIEKPLSHTIDGVDELIEVASSNNLVLMVGCNFRFHWGLKMVKIFLDEGKIGKVISARAEFGQYLPDWHPWEDYRQGYSAQQSLGGGIILDSIHELDYLNWLLGEVKQVYCYSDKMSNLEINVEDVSEMIFCLESKVIVSVHLDYIQRAYNRCLKIVAEEGTIIWSYQDNLVKFYLAGEGRWQTLEKNAPYDVNEMYVEEMKHFLCCIDGKDSPIADGKEGKRVLEIALAAKESARSSKVIFI